MRQLPASLALALALLSLPSLQACAYSVDRPALPPTLPRYASIDVAASELTVVDEDGEVDQESAAKARDDLAELLRDTRGSPPGGKPARFRATVHFPAPPDPDLPSNMGADGASIGALIMLGVTVCVPFGCTVFHDEAKVDLCLEIDGKRNEGHGEGDKYGSIYATPRRRAVALALERALDDATARWQAEAK